MTRSGWRRLTFLAFALAARPLDAAGPQEGGVLGWVEDSRGAPLSGAVISIFGRGVGGLTTLSDSAGRFSLSSLPAGSYTLRALRAGHQPAPARRLIVLPNQDATFTVSLTPLVEVGGSGEAAANRKEKEDEEAAAARELRWLLRHKRRSVLESNEAGASPAAESAPAADSRSLASWIPNLGGSLELMTTPSLVGVGPIESVDSEHSSLSVVRLEGRIAQSARWTLGGVVAERETTSWRMAGEFVFEPGGGHEIQAATGYGTRAYKGSVFGAFPDRGVGAASLQDRWQFADRLAATVGGRFSYVGYLRDQNYFDPIASLELRRDENTRVRGTMAVHTVVPGGDVLTLSTLSTTPTAPFILPEDGFRPERLTRYEVGVDQELGLTTVEAYTFFEGVRHQLVNSFEGAGLTRTLRIENGGRASARGMGLSVSRRFGEIFSGSMTYTYGQSHRDAPRQEHALLAYREGGFHDVAARFETFIEGTDTRLVAFCRLNQLTPQDGGESEGVPVRNTRFEIQLSQGLPFLGTLTHADWDFLLAVRNLFYEPTEGAVLDEMAVKNPPKRVLGGISVRF